MTLHGKVLIPGDATGDLIRLDGDISFWGGIDPATGAVIARQHPQHGASIAGRIVALQRSVGSSSGSSVLLELLANAIGPAGIVLGEPDLILTLGAVVAREMGFASIPVVQLAPARFETLPARLRISRSGCIGPA